MINKEVLHFLIRTPLESPVRIRVGGYVYDIQAIEENANAEVCLIPADDAVRALPGEGITLLDTVPLITLPQSGEVSEVETSKLTREGH